MQPILLTKSKRWNDFSLDWIYAEIIQFYQRTYARACSVNAATSQRRYYFFLWLSLRKIEKIVFSRRNHSIFAGNICLRMLSQRGNSFPLDWAYLDKISPQIKSMWKWFLIRLNHREKNTRTLNVSACLFFLLTVYSLSHFWDFVYAKN